MATGMQVIYRAQARCGCGWKGERRAGIKREPSGSLAYADTEQHRVQVGHAETRVEAWWRGSCRGCRVQSSERFAQVQGARAWAEQHQTSDVTHLRRLREHREHAEIAQRIADAIEP